MIPTEKLYKRIYKGIIHGLIQKYLNKCGGAFHVNDYGPEGRYVVIMDEEEYSGYINNIQK